VLSTSTLKEPIRFKMMMSTIRVNSFGGKERKLFFNCIFDLSPYRFTQISSVGTVGCGIKLHPMSTHFAYF
jgi:hypothetical protein